MSKIHFVEIYQDDVLTTLIFDLDKIEMIERIDNEIFIYTTDHVTTLKCSSVDNATMICVSLFDYWKYGNAPPPTMPHRFENN